MAKHAMAGDEVLIVTMSAGVGARDTGDVQARKDAANDAAKVLGAEVYVCDLPDNRFDSVDLLDIVRTAESWLDYQDPDVIYTHHCGDRNIDHRRTHDAVLTAGRPLPDSGVKKILAFEVASSTEWGTGFAPNYFVDVTGEPMLKKLQALDCYKSEMREFPHPRSEEGVKALATWRGATVGVKEAEAFMLVRSIE